MRGAGSAVPSSDPVQQVVHDFVVKPIADDPADPRRAHPSLLPQHPKRLRHGVFRPAQRDGEVADTDPRRAVQAEQDLQPIGVRQQVEALGPEARVDIGQRR